MNQFNDFWFCSLNLTKSITYKYIPIGENLEEACGTKEKIQEVNIEDTGVNLESEKPELEKKHHRNVVFQDFKKEQVPKTKDLTNVVKTPNIETREGCLIKYNVSTTPYLQR